MDGCDWVKLNIAHDGNLHFINVTVPERLRAMLRGRTWTTLLDLGCGDGGNLYALQQGSFIDYEMQTVYGADISPNRLQRVKVLCPKVQTIEVNACRVNALGDGSIDVLISTMVLEHVPDDREMLKEIARLLAPGGQAYITTVFKHKYSWYYYRSGGQWVLDPTHCREYTDDGPVLRMLHDLGLSIDVDAKTPMWFPLLDFVFRRMKMPTIYSWPIFRIMRRIKVPIVGYKTWEIVVSKNLVPGSYDQGVGKDGIHVV